MPSPHPSTAFLWDRRISAAQLAKALANPADRDHDAWLALVLREARPEQVWQWTTPEHVARHFERIAPRLGRRRAFWEWLLLGWRNLGLLP